MMGWVLWIEGLFIFLEMVFGVFGGSFSPNRVLTIKFVPKSYFLNKISSVVDVHGSHELSEITGTLSTRSYL